SKRSPIGDSPRHERCNRPLSQDRHRRKRGLFEVPRILHGRQNEAFSMQDIIILIFGFIGAAFALVALLFVIIIVLTITLAWVFELPYVPQNMRIRRRLAALKTPTTFLPTHEYIGWGTGIAVDGARKQIFLANATKMNIYGIDDLLEVEKDFKEEQHKFAYHIRITVKDVESPLFELTAALVPSKLRPIASLLSVLREENRAHEEGKAC